MERENVGMVQAFPQQDFLTKPLRLIMSPQRSAAEETHYPRCFTSIIIWSEPQRLDRDLSSTPFQFPQVGVPTCCEGHRLLQLEIFIDQV